MKYFAISDIHGYYNEMIKALKSAGYKKSDPNCTLIVCGDIFDRGPDAVKVYKYLRSIPKDRRILIRGNHEYLLRDAVRRGYFEQYDRRNRTSDTVKQFLDYYYPGTFYGTKYPLSVFENIGILKWIFSDEWVNFWELDDYIFVHSWIPVNTNSYFPMYEIGNYDRFELIDNWRESSDFDWEEATWGCPWLMYRKGLVPKGKTIVCGHWSTSEFRKALDGAKEDCDDNSLYRNNQLVALDASTIVSGHCNVFVLEK